MILFVKHISIEGPGFIGDFFEGEGYKSLTVDLSRGEALPGDMDDIDAVIVLGGPMNVYEDEEYPYLKEEDAFIKRVLKKEIPFMGICLGAQLLAKACGARVKKAPEEEIGFYNVTLADLSEEDVLFKGTERIFDVFQWHGDTFDLPPGGLLLVTGDTSANQAFRIGKNAYGLQFHLEVNDIMIKEWVREYLDSNDSVLRENGNQMVIRYDQLKDKLKKNAEVVCRNFCLCLTAIK